MSHYSKHCTRQPEQPHQLRHISDEPKETRRKEDHSDPERNSSCAATGCYLNGGPCRHTTDPAFAIPGAKGVPAKELLAVSFREVE